MNPSAILLLGPTGSGKSPLGDCLAASGLGGQPCRHFDFGANLRRVCEGDTSPAGIGPAERELIRRVLDEGALLEDDAFYVAEAILRDFIAREVDPISARVVMNGLPRHVSQAEAVGGLIDIRLLVQLACDVETVHQRIRTNAGGDREGRVDDDTRAVERKLALFEARTAPLVAHYRKKGVGILVYPVTVSTTSEEIRARIEQESRG